MMKEQPNNKPVCEGCGKDGGARGSWPDGWYKTGMSKRFFHPTASHHKTAGRPLRNGAWWCSDACNKGYDNPKSNKVPPNELPLTRAAAQPAAQAHATTAPAVKLPTDNIPTIRPFRCLGWTIDSPEILAWEKKGNER